MTTSHDARITPVLPGIQRVQPPNGVRSPIFGGDAGPLSLDPNLVPRPPIRPEDVPSGAAPAVPMPVPAFLAPAALAAAPQPVTTPWWLDPNTLFAAVQNHPPQFQILWALGQLTLGKLPPGTTRETIVHHYMTNGLGDAAGAATREFDAYFMSLPQPMSAPAPQAAPALTPQEPVVFDFELYSKRPEARAIAIAVAGDAPDAAIHQLYGGEGVLYAQHLRRLPKIDQTIAASHAQAAERRATLPQTPPAEAAPAPAVAVPVSQPVPAAPAQPGPVPAQSASNGRMTTARKLEAEQMFVAGATVADVAAKLSLPLERIERAQREWTAQGGKISLTAEEALPPTSPLMQALTIGEQRAALEQATAPLLVEAVPAQTSQSMLHDGLIGRAVIQAVTIAGRVGVSFNTLLLLLEELDRITPEDRSTLLGTMRGLAASREG